MSMAERPTLIPPPDLTESQSDIEGVLELLHLKDIDPNLWTNTRPTWHPPGARGIYGGTVIAQCLAAAQKSVPEDFDIHSMHCFFVLAGNADIPIIYHVEHVRSGRSFATRTVQARQRGNVIFTTTMSFVRQGAGGKKLLQHAATMPYVPGPEDESIDNLRVSGGADGPVISRMIDIQNNDSPYPQTKKTRQWIKARGTISEAGGHHAHLAAVAYMSDSYFIGTVSRVHKLWRIPAQNQKKTIKEDDLVRKTFRNGDDKPSPTKPKRESRPVVSMMVSLDHTIYFHDPRGFRADDWLFTEMESPWAGDGRGLVIQRIYTKEGKLIAHCVQEGVVRLKQDQDSKL